MADKKASAEDDAGALDGTEIVRVVKGGVSKRSTSAAIAGQMTSAAILAAVGAGSTGDVLTQTAGPGLEFAPGGGGGDPAQQANQPAFLPATATSPDNTLKFFANVPSSTVVTVTAVNPGGTVAETTSSASGNDVTVMLACTDDVIVATADDVVAAIVNDTDSANLLSAMNLGWTADGKENPVVAAFTQMTLTGGVDTTAAAAGKFRVDAAGTLWYTYYAADPSYTYFSGWYPLLGPDANFNSYIGVYTIDPVYGAHNTLVGLNAGARLGASNRGHPNDSNVMVGEGAGSSNQGPVSGNYNVYVGPLAGADSNGQSNVGIGRAAVALCTGDNNVGIGYNALEPSDGSRNIALGWNAGAQNAGDANVLIGPGAVLGTGDGNSGDYNVAIGQDALGPLGATNSGDKNVAIGYQALGHQTSGHDNVAIGSSAGAACTTGAQNVLVGNGLDLDDPTDNNCVVIGSGVSGNGSNTVRIGNDDVVSLQVGGAVGINGAFMSQDGKTVTVSHGLITSIV